MVTTYAYRYWDKRIIVNYDMIPEAVAVMHYVYICK